MSPSSDLAFENRQIRLVTPLGPKKTNLVRAEIEEGLSKLTEVSLEFISSDMELDLGKIVGERLGVELDAEDGQIRHFGGHCIAAEYLGLYQGQAHYRAELRPWLWFLTRDRDCRIFQDVSAMEIVKKVFNDCGFSDFEDKTKHSFRKRDYCVQYRESSFEFLSRLMEEEGIYFFFKSDGSKDILVLADDQGAHAAVPHNDTIEFYFREPEYRRKTDHIFEWRGQERVQSGKVTLTDYNFEKPSADLKSTRAIAKGKHKHKNFEIYDYPGHHRETADGEYHARVKMEATAAQHMRSKGAGNVRFMAAGTTFRLAKHPRQAQNVEYLVVSARHELQIETDYEDEDTLKPILGEQSKVDPNENPDTYRCTFEVLPTTEPFRAPQTTRWPEISGIQTAVVVGKTGEEIWTDKYGRVKVQFHWDRLGKKDEKSSCWVRTAVPWTGKNFGMVSVPRMGQEVVIQFEEGDPDRPLITGMLYNAQTMPPYTLPDNQTQAGIMTNKSKGGGGANELVMDDAKEKEFVRFQSERDYKQIIKNNAEITIGLEHKDKGDLTQTIHRHKTETLNTGDHTFQVKDGKEVVSIAKTRNSTVGQSETVSIGTEKSESTGSSYTIDVGTELTITAGTRITLKVGASKIVMDAASITLESVQITGSASATMAMSGGASAEFGSDGILSVSATMVDIAGDAMATMGAPMVDIAGDGMLMLGGGVVMVN
ncbi:MAG: type VI secretion system tip protein TssI/VgrG [Pseudomonadota bacterium]